jgi:hypothetical protein
MSLPPRDSIDRLEVLLARWAAIHRLTDERAAAVRESILQPATLDGDWLWGLMRPVTSLLDGPNRLNDMLSGLVSVGA